MKRFRLWPARQLKLLAPLVIMPLAAISAWSLGAIGFFGSAPVLEANAAMFGPPAKIDGKRAFSYLTKICDIGPRQAGSEANKRQFEMVEAHFKLMGAEVTPQPWGINHPQTGKRLTLRNLIGSWHPERAERVVIGAHYDTRPHPDEEADPQRHALPFIGANDGASGVALLMEIAHHLNNLNTRFGVDLVLFDGEELVYGNDPDTRRGKYFLGSTEFARRYVENSRARRNNGQWYFGGIVLDMVGGRDLRLPRDPYSMEHAGRLVDEVWSVAAHLRSKSFLNERGPEVTDDHIPLNQAQIPTIDIIDFQYRFWHTADDVPDNCSAASLEEVGQVVTAWLAAHPAGEVAAPAPKRKKR